MKPEIRSRRDRPTKPPLSRAWIVAETIGIMKEEGLDKATMRRVAQALDTGPASLYVYFANTAELHGAVLEELVQTLPDAGTEDWRGQIEVLLNAYGEVLSTYPGLARSALMLPPTGPNMLRLFDRVMALLLDGGVPVERAAWGTDLLILHVTASAAEHSAPAANDPTPYVGGRARVESLREALDSASPDALPTVSAHADAIMAGPPRARASWAIHAIIAGIGATPVPHGSDTIDCSPVTQPHKETP